MGEGSSRIEARAFRALVEEFAGLVHSVIAQVLFRGTAAEVDELAQETFIRVHRGLADFEAHHEGALRRWIAVIATRVALDRLRQRQVPVIPLHPELGAELAHRSDTDDLARYRELREAVEEVLGSLDEPQRTALVLREQHGLSYAEIAELQGVEEGTVKSRIGRARSLIRQEVKHALGR